MLQAPVELISYTLALNEIFDRFSSRFWSPQQDLCPVSEGQFLQSAWPLHMIQALIEACAKCQVLQVARQNHVLQRTNHVNVAQQVQQYTLDSFNQRNDAENNLLRGQSKLEPFAKQLDHVRQQLRLLAPCSDALNEP